MTLYLGLQLSWVYPSVWVLFKRQHSFYTSVSRTKVVWLYLNNKRTFHSCWEIFNAFILKYANPLVPGTMSPSVTLNLLHKLTCDDTGEGTVHSHWGEGGGGPAKGRHYWRRPPKGREAGSVTVVAVVVCLHSWGMTHQGGIRPVVAQVGVDRCGICVVRSVLQGRALVLFTPDTTHRLACRRRRKSKLWLSV